MTVRSIDARSGQARGWHADLTSLETVDEMVSAARDAQTWLTGLQRRGRAQLLNLFAFELAASTEGLTAIADAETALGEARMRSELARTCYQLRFMGIVAEEGSYLEASVEHARETPLGPQPDLRRINFPIGPVAVFGSSNFPFAFGVAGGDSASALAAGCPVLVRAHSSHPELSHLVCAALARVVESLAGPAGVLQAVFGREAGAALVRHPSIRAVGFTGSLGGGRALYNEAAARAEPLPFSGELGSVNPLVVTSAAAQSRALEIAEGLAASMTMGAGQFCTKPGLFLVPRSQSGDELVADLAHRINQTPPAVLLSDGIADTFRSGVAAVLQDPSVSTLSTQAGDLRKVAPVLVEIDAMDFNGPTRAILSEEYFGPSAVVVRWSEMSDVTSIVGDLAPALTGTVHSLGTEDAELAAVATALSARSGRLIFNGHPTGVCVAWGMNHGGQCPSSMSTSTSVGASAISRWVRPISFQNAPNSMLPSGLRDSEIVTFPHRWDGMVRPASIPALTNSEKPHA